MMRVGAAALVAQGIGLFALTIYFGVLFPSAGLTSPGDFADAGKYLPVVAAHPSWFYIPEWALGVVNDGLFLIGLACGGVARARPT